MIRSLPSRRRFARAGLAFALTLVTATLLWNQGRREGLQEGVKSLRAMPSPDTGAFDTPTNLDYAARLAALQAKRPRAMTREAKLALAREFTELALAAHFRNTEEGILSLAAYDNALVLQREVGNRRGEADTRMNRATTLGMLGHPTEARRELYTAYELFCAQPDTSLQQAEVLCRLGQKLILAQRLTEAHRILDRSLRIRQKMHEENGVADCLAALGELAINEQHFAEARKLLSDAAQIYTSLGKTPARAAVLGQLGDLAFFEGDNTEANQLYTEGLAVWKSLDQGYWIGIFLARQAEVALAQGRIAHSESLATESLTLLKASNSPHAIAWPLKALGRIAHRRGDAKTERIYFDEACTHFRSAGNVRYGWTVVPDSLPNY